jgi:hypothetical protein
MSKEKCIDKMTYVRVSCGNVERIKAVGKKGETFDDVMTMLLDFYEDLRRQDWVNTQSNESQYKEQISG